MKNKILFVVGAILLVALGILIFNYGTRAEMPLIDPGGKINGNYSLKSIMQVAKPYVCTFEKSDSTAKISGIIHTDGKSVYGQFRILSDLVQNEFNSFLLIKNKEAFVWTAEKNVGYETAAATSASKNASPEEQGQIVGIEDKMDYKCEPWQNADQTIFEVPSWVNFVKL